MNILVLGTGGREHALAWRLSKSPSVTKVYLHPGNAGAARSGLPTLPDNPSLSKENVEKAAVQAKIDLIVIGPEVLLAEGYGDYLRSKGFAVAGPNRKEAQLETSKIFAKEFMIRAKLPTAAYFTAENDRELFGQTVDRQSWPVVLKLDGLAAGKGVVIAYSQRDIEQFADRIWGQKEFGPGPHRVLVEEFITGRELSYIGLCDGKQFRALASATDYKRVGDGNIGPNTGGMGCISPSPYFTPELEAKIETTIIAPMLRQFEKENFDYRGALYVGVMIDASGNPFVLEFNARFGDPETQAILLRLQSDFAELLEHTAKKTLENCPAFRWTPEVSVYIVGAAEGYPGKVTQGDEISGLETIHSDTQVFFSGVGQRGNSLVTAGGRVLGVGTLAPSFSVARERLYHDLKRVHWRGIHYRNDIGAS